MRRSLPYLVFAACSLIASFLLDSLIEAVDAPPWAMWLTPWIAALAAVASGLRVGPMSAQGVFFTTLILLVIVYTATVAIYHSLAVPVGGSVGFFDLFRVGGLHLGISIASSIAAPLAWLFILSGRRPHHVQKAQP